MVKVCQVDWAELPILKVVGEVVCGKAAAEQLRGAVANQHECFPPICCLDCFDGDVESCIDDQGMWFSIEPGSRYAAGLGTRVLHALPGYGKVALLDLQLV